ncbi:MAG: DUF6677 family protein [Bacillota bacterium]
MKRTNLVPAPVVALAGWLLPGAGYWLVRERARSLTVGITIIVLFGMGLLIGGIRVVEAPSTASGNPLQIALDKPWFVGQVLAGPMALASASLGHPAAESGRPGGIYLSHSRVNEIGTLYTAVAGMLNLLVIIDATSRATRGGGQS